MNSPSSSQIVLTAAGRIYALIPQSPEIMHIDEAAKLRGLGALKLDDLNPSLMELRYALAIARSRYRELHDLL